MDWKDVKKRCSVAPKSGPITRNFAGKQSGPTEVKKAAQTLNNESSSKIRKALTGSVLSQAPGQGKT